MTPSARRPSEEIIRSQHYIEGEDWSPWRSDLSRWEEIRQARQEAAAALDRPSVDKYALAVETLPDRRGCLCDFSGSEAAFGTDLSLTSAEEEDLTRALRGLMPWRKGPFRYGPVAIDAEWRSDWKWERILQGAGLTLRGRRILDAGCNNLYYAYRMLAEDPELVYGIDPMVRYYVYHALNRRFYEDPRLRFDLFGVEHLGLYPQFFDIIFHMGILYHRRDPLAGLRDVHQALRPGGELVLESAGIPGREPICLFPEGRYMKAPGYWFLPTVSALEAMVRRSGFSDVVTFSVESLTTDEQRQTSWAVFQSLADFLDPDDPSKTVEGYPAPLRIALKARKKVS